MAGGIRAAALYAGTRNRPGKVAFDDSDVVVRTL